MSPDDPPLPTEPAPVAGVPVRYRRGPLVGLVLMALVPLAALTALLLWSDAQADEHEAATQSDPIDHDDAAEDPVLTEEEQPGYEFPPYEEVDNVG